MQSGLTTSSLIRQVSPNGRLRFDGPKSVRSKITTLLLCRSCMCMAEIPILLCRRTQFPNGFLGSIALLILGGKKRSSRPLTMICVGPAAGMGGVASIAGVGCVGTAVDGVGAIIGVVDCVGGGVGGGMGGVGSVGGVGGIGGGGGGV